jgi:hypothetical protein
MDKRKALRQLARKRQRARWPGYKNLRDYHGGAYECLHVSPYTKSAGNVNSPLMVFLQDWNSDDSIRRGLDPDCIKLGYTPSLPTNRNLIRLLQMHFHVSLAIFCHKPLSIHQAKAYGKRNSATRSRASRR